MDLIFAPGQAIRGSSKVNQRPLAVLPVVCGSGRINLPDLGDTNNGTYFNRFSFRFIMHFAEATSVCDVVVVVAVPEVFVAEVPRMLLIFLSNLDMQDCPCMTKWKKKTPRNIEWLI